MPSEEKVGLFPDFLERAKRERRPLNLTVELAHTCNFACRHCYNFDRGAASPPPPAVQRGRLTREILWPALREARALGTIAVCFTGGEALLHPDFFAHVEFVRSLHLAVRLKTNASAIDETMAARLKRAGVADVDVSVYGFSEAAYAHFTRRTGMFARVVRGLHAIKSAGLGLSLNFIMHRQSLTEFSAMDEFAKELDVPHNFSFEITKRYDDTSLGPTDVPTLTEIETILASENGKRLRRRPDADAGFHCACALTNCAITKDGNVYPCIGAPVDCGNIFTSSFTEIWRTSPALERIRNLAREDFKACAGCGVRPFCEKSPGSAYTNSGDYAGRDEWACGVAAINARLYNEGRAP